MVLTPQDAQVVRDFIQRLSLSPGNEAEFMDFAWRVELMCKMVEGDAIDVSTMDGGRVLMVPKGHHYFVVPETPVEKTIQKFQADVDRREKR